MEIKSWLKNVGVGMVKNRCGQSGHKTLKLAVSQEGINEINLFFACWVYNEGLFYFLYSCTNPIFGKNPVPEIWAKLLLASQIAWFFS